MSDENNGASVTDDLLARATEYASAFDKGDLPMPPARGVAIVTCMDARVNPYGLFALSEGDAHVLRNAGGLVTDDVLHALAISQRLLGTAEVMIVHHADCGMRRSDHAAFHRAIFAETGIRPTWPETTFADPESSVRASVARVRECPFLPRRGSVRGFVYDEGTGGLHEVR